MAGASFAESEVTMGLDQFTSLDRGYDDKGTQVWGSEKEPTDSNLMYPMSSTAQYSSNFFSVSDFKYSNQVIIFEFARHFLPLSFFKFVMYYFIIKKQ